MAWRERACAPAHHCLSLRPVRTGCGAMDTTMTFSWQSCEGLQWEWVSGGCVSETRDGGHPRTESVRT